MTNGVDHDIEIRNSDFREEEQQHLDDFRLDRGIVGAGENLGACLYMLPVSSLLRAFAPKHGRDVIELHHPGFVLKLVLDISADDRSRPFRAQAQRAAVPIGERVHFFGDNIGFLADATDEQLRRLEDRRPDLAEPIGMKDIPDTGFNRVPDFDVPGKNVVGASNRVDHSVFLCISRYVSLYW